jgi:hypothetical protein
MIRLDHVSKKNCAAGQCYKTVAAAEKWSSTAADPKKTNSGDFADIKYPNGANFQRLPKKSMCDAVRVGQTRSNFNIGQLLHGRIGRFYCTRGHRMQSSGGIFLHSFIFSQLFHLDGLPPRHHLFNFVPQAQNTKPPHTPRLSSL